MLSERDLRELLDYSAPAPVVSLYLATDPTDGNADAHRLRLRNLLKEIDLPADQSAIERYFDHEHPWTGRSVAVFSCASQNYFRAFPLAIPVRDWLRIDTRPMVKPLVDLLDAYGGYGVVMVDKQGARLFAIHMGELRDQQGVLGEAVKHTKTGGASAMPGRRGGVAGQTHYEDEVVERNMKEVVEFAVHFFEENHIRRVLIGGPDDNVAQFRSLLPKAWQSLVMGSFPISMTATGPEVVDKAIQVGQEAERRREDRLIDTAINSAAKGGNGSLGLGDTLRAIHDGRVQTLLIDNGFREPGYHCTSCGYLTVDKVDRCPFCGSAFEEIPDAVEMGIRRVLTSGGDVEIIHDNPTLQTAGCIAGLLRY
jgi:peptide subunit release factor 1 (eRF1)